MSFAHQKRARKAKLVPRSEDEICDNECKKTPSEDIKEEVIDIVEHVIGPCDQNGNKTSSMIVDVQIKVEQVQEQNDIQNPNTTGDITNDGIVLEKDKQNEAEVITSRTVAYKVKSPKCETDNVDLESELLKELQEESLEINKVIQGAQKNFVSINNDDEEDNGSPFYLNASTSAVKNTTEKKATENRVATKNKNKSQMPLDIAGYMCLKCNRQMKNLTIFREHLDACHRLSDGWKVVVEELVTGKHLLAVPPHMACLRSCLKCREQFTSYYDQFQHKENCLKYKVVLNRVIYDYLRRKVSKATNSVITHYKCLLCDHLTLNYEEFLQHLQTKHGDPKKIKIFAENIKGVGYVVAGSIKLAAVGKTQCESCHTTFIYRYNWLEHVLKTSYTCSVCYQVFRKCEDLVLHKSHCQETQLTTIIFKCSICNELFPLEKRLDEHLVKVHGMGEIAAAPLTTVRGVKCNLCMEQYYQVPHLCKMKKEFICHYCKMHYPSNSMLTAHYTRIVDINASCLKCGTIFQKDCVLRNHKCTGPVKPDKVSYVINPTIINLDEEEAKIVNNEKRNVGESVEISETSIVDIKEEVDSVPVSNKPASVATVVNKNAVITINNVPFVITNNVITNFSNIPVSANKQKANVSAEKVSVIEKKARSNKKAAQINIHKAGINNENTETIEDKADMNKEKTVINEDRTGVTKENTETIKDKACINNENIDTIKDKADMNKEKTVINENRAGVTKENTETIKDKTCINKENMETIGKKTRINKEKAESKDDEAGINKENTETIEDKANVNKVKAETNEEVRNKAPSEATVVSTNESGNDIFEVIKEEPIDMYYENNYEFLAVIKGTKNNTSALNELKVKHSETLTTEVTIKTEVEEEPIDDMNVYIDEDNTITDTPYTKALHENKEYKTIPSESTSDADYEDDMFLLNSDECLRAVITSTKETNKPNKKEPETIRSKVKCIVRRKKREKVYSCVKCNFQGHHLSYKAHKKAVHNYDEKKPRRVYKRKEKTHYCEYCKQMYINPSLHVKSIRQHFAAIRILIDEANDRSQLQCNKCKEVVHRTEMCKHLLKHPTTDYRINKQDDTANKFHVDDVKDNKLIQAQIARQCMPKDLLQCVIDAVLENTFPKKRGFTKPCIVCGKFFNRWMSVKRHLIEHLLDDAYAKKGNGDELCCQICSEIFSHDAAYKLHMRQHGNLAIYHCSLCDKNFSDSSNFSKHKKLHNHFVMTCDLCRRKFSSKKTLIQHFEDHKRSKPLICTACDPPRILYFSSDYAKHMNLVHIKATCKYVCQDCKLRFWSLKEKWNHIWEAHGKRRINADCPICNEKFRRFCDLKSHMWMVHNYKLGVKKKQFKTSCVRVTAGPSLA